MQIRQRSIVITFLIFSLSNFLTAQDKESIWVDSVMDIMTPIQRLGQLFMIRAHSDLGPEHIEEVKRQIKEYEVGALCFFQGTPEKQVELTNNYQQLSSIPLLVAVDAEWGPGMRFKDAGFSYPRQLTLGAIQDNRLIYEMGKDIGRQLKRIGVHVNFAPVVDVNNNPQNPVINDRSFGEDRYNVTAKSYMYMRGMQKEGVMACAKHFPGHGDTDVDSHLDLPVISHDMNRLDSIELYPFKTLISRGIQSMMIAHLQVPAIDNTPNLPTSLSSKMINGLIRDSLKFEGLIFTDALEMKGVTKHYADGEVEAKSLIAGNDILCLPQDIDESFKIINQYLQKGLLTQAEIDVKVRRVLRAKYRLHLTETPIISTDGLKADLFRTSSTLLKTDIYEKATTLLSNEKNIIPLKHLDLMNIATLAIGVERKTHFQNRIEDYIDSQNFTTQKEISEARNNELINKLSEKDVVIVSIHDMSKYASKNFGIPNSTRLFIKNLVSKTKVILVLFGSPYSTQYFEDIPALICAFQDEDIAQDIVAQQLVGALPFQGRMPVTSCEKFPFNKGIITRSLQRLGYSIPEKVGLLSDSLDQLASIVERMVEERAAPGCQILVAKNGKIVYEKTFGYQEYDGKKKIKATDIYDLASITKVAATTLAIMKLVSDGDISVKDRLDSFLPQLENTNKGSITIEEVMTHHGGFIGWIPFYKETLTGSFRSPRPDPKWYRNVKSREYNIPVANKLYMKSNFQDTIFHKIINSDLRSTRGYRYSDLGFYLLAELVKEVSGIRLDSFCQKYFYRPMNLRSTLFNPSEKISDTRIVPSENDSYFRRQKIQGYVHDMGAAMLGGVSGHAGLFSNAKELAILLQMLLNEGYYGGTQYIKPEVISQFTKRYIYSTRRGIGFDMKELDISKTLNVSEKASIIAFGHTGFTGTCAWADPSSKLIFIFLSNRTFPNMNNNKLHKNNYRLRLHSKVYESRFK